jgi:hypothetical protein
MQRLVSPTMDSLERILTVSGQSTDILSQALSRYSRGALLVRGVRLCDDKPSNDRLEFLRSGAPEPPRLNGLIRPFIFSCSCKIVLLSFSLCITPYVFWKHIHEPHQRAGILQKSSVALIDVFGGRRMHLETHRPDGHRVLRVLRFTSRRTLARALSLWRCYPRLGL